MRLDPCLGQTPQLSTTSAALYCMRPGPDLFRVQKYPQPHTLDLAGAQVRSQQSRTAGELAEASKKAVLADKLQAQLQEASDALLERDSELQDLHQDVEQVQPSACCADAARLVKECFPLCCRASSV